MKSGSAWDGTKFKAQAEEEAEVGRGAECGGEVMEGYIHWVIEVKP